ncbi:UDP-N-acetylmuramoyl-L-alanyl-D-glutamate--2,6-diaminopimelate ligase [Bacteroidota bacterium]
MKTLREIIKNCIPLKVYGSQDKMISGMHFDSRKIQNDFVFFAIKGTLTDGHEYINQAIEKGATAIICENVPDQLNKDISYIQVENSAETFGICSSEYYDNPSRKIKLIGVTGTNGKTTVATVLFHLIRKMGRKAGLISTIKYMIDDEEFEASHTTPDQLFLNQFMAKMVQRGCEYGFMEVSSHAIAQHRINGLHFTGGIFTNITHEHIDYHGAFKEYVSVKKRFFDKLTPSSFAIINADDKNGHVMVQNSRSRVHFYALRKVSEYKAKIIESIFEGTLVKIENNEVWLKFIGEFNVYNLLAVYGCALNLGFGKKEVLRTLSLINPVKGRFEHFKIFDDKTVIIDYAHTPDALKNILLSINKLKNKSQKIITAVGAGGERDKEKRPVMGKISVQYSNKVVFTSDNPRFEDETNIIADLVSEIDKKDAGKFLVIQDRRQAIKTAIMLANRGDIILLAGKGHELYQEIKGKKIPFDERKIVEELLN